ncbi:ketopantoate reductase PanE/ApbA C terminal-domain-containing protein [Aspergillus californicus]
MPPKYSICLIGSGGVGTIASLVLTKSPRAKVTVVLRSKYNYVSEHGWEIDSIDHGQLAGWKPHRLVPLAAEAAADPETGETVEYDYVVVATKAIPGVISVAEVIAPVITAGKTTIVLIQNGIGIEDDVVAAYPGNSIMSSVSHIGSEIQAPNVVSQSGKDVSKMGAHLHTGVVDSASISRAREFVEMYAAGGASVCEFVLDIQRARWEKLLWNGTFNTVCALLRMDVGEMQRSGGRESMLVPMMWEIWAIAKADGHGLPDDIVSWMAYRLPDDCSYRPSMLLDLENGRAMEVEVILGNPLRKARQLGVQTPLMDAVYRLLLLEEWKVNQMSLTH